MRLIISLNNHCRNNYLVGCGHGDIHLRTSASTVMITARAGPLTSGRLEALEPAPVRLFYEGSPPVLPYNSLTYNICGAVSVSRPGVDAHAPAHCCEEHTMTRARLIITAL